MNINAPGLEIRQGFPPAEELPVAPPPATPAPQKLPEQENVQTVAANDPSLAAATAADRQTALETADKLARQLESTDTSLKIRLLDNSHTGVQVEIVDTSSNKVLRKIPQDELIKLSASIKKMTGVFLDQST